VHDPVGLEALGRLPAVEHERLLHADLLAIAGGGRQDGLVGAGCLPVPRRRRPVRPRSVRVLAVPWAEEVPLVLPEARLI
jgi:hypothetical protein